MNVDQAANLASSFGLAAERCLERRPQSGGKFQMLVVAAVVCAAFSSELGLKTLLLMKGRECRGHDLLDLFLELDATDQAAIVRTTGMERGALLEALTRGAKRTRRVSGRTEALGRTGRLELRCSHPASPPSRPLTIRHD